MENKEKRRELYQAIKDGDLDQVKLILGEYPDMLEQLNVGSTPLFEALGVYARAKGVHSDPDPDEQKAEAVSRIVHYLVTLGADVNARTSRQVTPIFRVVTAEHAKLLIDAGADVNARGESNSTPLFTVWYEVKPVEYDRVLIDAGADVDARDDAQQTPLFHTTSAEHAKLLLEAGADVDARDGQQQTPVFHVLDKPEVVELLLDAGADPNAKNNVDRVALEYAAANCYTYDGSAFQYWHVPEDRWQYAKSVDLLLKYGAETSLYAAVLLKPVEFVRQWLESDPDAIAKVRFPDALLRYSIELADRDDRNEINNEYVEKRLADGHQPTEDLMQLKKPRDERKRMDAVPLVKLFLEHGIQPTNDMLFSAVRRGRQGLEIARVLLEGGADPNVKDEEGRTVLKFVSLPSKVDDPLALTMVDELTALLKEFGGKLRPGKAKKKQATKAKRASQTKKSAGESLLDKIQELMTPPDAPVDVDESVLPQVVDKLGTKLPADFLQFARIYGSGAIRIHGAGDWEVWSPFSLAYLMLAKTFFEIHDELRDAIEIPMDLYPESGGVLPCANNHERGYLGWSTGGKPNDWQAVQFDSDDEPPATVHAMGFTELIYQIITRKIVLKGMQGIEPWDPEVDISFRPKEIHAS